MGFDFDPTFWLLAKFGMGFRPIPTSKEEIKRISTYLGINLPAAADLQENADRLSSEIESRNGFLNAHLGSDAIYDSDEYRRSLFIRDIVANNRNNRPKRLAAKH